MKQLLILIISIIMTGNITAQENTQLSKDGRVMYFQSKVNIPKGYALKRKQSIEVNNVKAHLYRYEKDYNQGLGSEHFSFIITDTKPHKILGFTLMDTQYSLSQKKLSKVETETIAREFLVKIDTELNNSLSNLWTEEHDEVILINGQEQTIRGMKYKCYREANDDYTWVIVGSDGSIITFERDIKWHYEEKQRISEKYLHDNWLVVEDKKAIEKVRQKKLNGI